MNIASRQNILFYLLITCFAMINILTIDWFPGVWIDEILFADPPINFVQGDGFTSTVWYTQNSSEYWASYPPLYHWLLIPWLKLFGISIISVRSVGVLYMLLASMVGWNLLRKTGIATSFMLKMLFILVLWAGHGISLIYRQGRSDALTILLVFLVANVFFSSGRYRNVLIYIVGFVCALPGIQLPPFIVIVLLFYAAVSKERKEILWFALKFSVGVLVGLCTLFLFLYSKGVLYVYLTQTFASGAMITGQLAQMVVYSDGIANARFAKLLTAYAGFYKLYLRDISCIWLSGYLIFVNVYNATLGNTNKRMLHWLLLYSIIPVSMLLLGKYPVSYSWMGYIIVVAGVTYTISFHPVKWIKTLGIGVILMACLCGFPADMLRFRTEGAIAQRNITEFVWENLSESDVVYGEHVAYYSCKTFTREFYATSYSGGRTFPVISGREQNSITALLINTGKLDNAIKKIRGDWELYAELSSQHLSLYKRKQHK